MKLTHFVKQKLVTDVMYILANIFLKPIIKIC